MNWLALMLIALIATPSDASGDGQPPMTIIEIPTAPTTTVTAPSVVTPETSVLTTIPAPATSSPQIADVVLPTVRSPFRSWMAVALIAGGLMMLALGSSRRLRLPGDNVPPVVPVAVPVPAVSPVASGPYEAVEYRSESGTSEVQPRALGEFSDLKAAIDKARLARSWFVNNSPAEAFWVVWDTHLKRAAWIAESSTPGESVIDLRTGRRQPYTAESAKT